MKLKTNKKSSLEYQMSGIMIWEYHDISTCNFTIHDKKNQDLCAKKGDGYKAYLHINLLYGGL